MLNFDSTFDRLIGSEGGYSNNPKDPGGETNWGISKASYPHVDIKNLTREGAKKIYLEDFWIKLRASEMHPTIAFQLFDFAVNSSISTSIRYLQQAIGVADDGHWGPISKAALDKFSDLQLIVRLNSLRLNFMTRLSNWDNAGRGWARRISTNLMYGANDTLGDSNG